MEACFRHRMENKKVIATFYLTILTFFLTIASLHLAIVTLVLIFVIYKVRIA